MPREYSNLKFAECGVLVQTHSIEWNASCVPQFWRRLRHRTRYEKKRKGDRIARVTIQFKDLGRHATKKSIPLLPPPAEGWRRYGWRLFSVEVDEGTGGGTRPGTPVVINYRDVLRVTWKSGCAPAFLTPARISHPSISRFAYSLVLCTLKNNLKKIPCS